MKHYPETLAPFLSAERLLRRNMLKTRQFWLTVKLIQSTLHQHKSEVYALSVVSVIASREPGTFILYIIYTGN